MPMRTLAVLVACTAIGLSFVALAAQEKPLTTPKAAADKPAPKTADKPGADGSGIDFDKVVAELRPELEAFLKLNTDAGPTPSALMKKYAYKAEDTLPLSKALQKDKGKGIEDLYLDYQLLQPLLSCPSDQLKPLREPLVNLLRQRCRYQFMIVWKPQDIATLNPPANMPAKELTQQMEKIQKLRGDKQDKESVVVRFNRTVNALENTVKQVLAKLDDGSGDETLLPQMAGEERQELATWINTFNILKDAVPKMSQPRAQKLYRQLKGIISQPPVKKQYVNPTSPNYSITGHSSFAKTQGEYLVFYVMDLMNALADPAKEPKLAIPDIKEWEAKQAELKKAAEAKKDPKKK